MAYFLTPFFNLEFDDPRDEQVFMDTLWRARRGPLLKSLLLFSPAVVLILYGQLRVTQRISGVGTISAVTMTLMTIFVVLDVLGERYANAEETARVKKNDDEGATALNSALPYRLAGAEGSGDSVPAKNLFPWARPAVSFLALMQPVVMGLAVFLLGFFLCSDVDSHYNNVECNLLVNGYVPPWWHYGPSASMVVACMSGVKLKNAAVGRFFLLFAYVLAFLERLPPVRLVSAVALHVVIGFMLLFGMFSLEAASRNNFIETRNRVKALLQQHKLALRGKERAEARAREAEQRAQAHLRETFRVSFPDYDLVSRQTLELIQQAQAKLPEAKQRNLVRFEAHFEDFELERKLSSGGFATVYRGTFRGQPCAVKSISARNNLSIGGIKGLIYEVLTLSTISHPYIVRTLGCCWSPHICLLLEYMPKGTLRDLLAYRALELSWERPLLGCATQVASALEYLHSRDPPIIHRDVKTRNILMKDFATCKLADFGLSIELGQGNTMGTVAGTKRYCAPEVLKSGTTTPKADVWSYGVVLWEMAARTHFKERLVKATELPSVLPYPLPNAVRTVIRQCLAVDPEKRPTFEQILTLLGDAEREIQSDAWRETVASFNAASELRAHGRRSSTVTNTARTESGLSSDTVGVGGTLKGLDLPTVDASAASGAATTRTEGATREYTFDGTTGNTAKGEFTTDGGSSSLRFSSSEPDTGLGPESGTLDVGEDGPLEHLDNGISGERDGDAFDELDHSVSMLSGVHPAHGELLWGDMVPRTVRGNEALFEQAGNPLAPGAFGAGVPPLGTLAGAVLPSALVRNAGIAVPPGGLPRTSAAGSVAPGGTREQRAMNTASAPRRVDPEAILSRLNEVDDDCLAEFESKVKHGTMSPALHGGVPPVGGLVKAGATVPPSNAAALVARLNDADDDCIAEFDSKVPLSSMQANAFALQDDDDDALPSAETLARLADVDTSAPPPSIDISAPPVDESSPASRFAGSSEEPGQHASERDMRLWQTHSTMRARMALVKPPPPKRRSGHFSFERPNLPSLGEGDDDKSESAAGHKQEDDLRGEDSAHDAMNGEEEMDEW